MTGYIKVIFFTAAILYCFCLHSAPLGPDDKDALPKISQPGIYQGYTSAQYKGFSYTSHYIVMRDSVLLAADIFLPKHLEKGKKVPTILYLTRYVRTIQAKVPFEWIEDPIFGDISEEEIRFFTSYGYACVIVDVRGSGASTGQRKMEFSKEEVADGKEIVDWIIAQPWSDQQVGSTGVSYVGTTAELLLANKHPNVKACIPRCNIFDLYDDMVFPGGVCQGPFIRVWGGTTKSLDNNDFKPFTSKYRLLLGIHTVKDDKGRKIWKKALALHKENFDVSTGLDKIAFRDDVQQRDGLVGSLDDFSIHTRVKDIEASGTPIYRMDGWYDAALAKGCIDDWLNTSNTKKVLIGPWDHGPRSDVSPYAKSKKVKFDLNAEMLRFFDHYLKGIDNGIDKEPVLTYYTVGEEKWKTADTWPVAGVTLKKWNLTPDRTLNPQERLHAGNVEYKVDYSASSGKTAGWNSLTDQYMSGPTNYPDRSSEDKKMACFTSDAFPGGMIITGTPVVHLDFAADSSDATVFCYLEDVGTDGSVTYITEGYLRMMQRKLSTKTPYKTTYPNHSFLRADEEPYKPGSDVELMFDLLPVSYQLKAGHKLRLSVAGTDAGHFDLPSPKPTSFRINSSSHRFSYLELPVSEQ